MTVSPQRSYATPVVEHHGFAFFSGQLPRTSGGDLLHPGIVGDSVDVADARTAAQLAARTCVKVIHELLGERFLRIVKVTGYVASAADFTGQSHVINAASQVLVDELGFPGEHARTAIGVARLPEGACVEIDVVAATKLPR